MVQLLCAHMDIHDAGNSWRIRGWTTNPLELETESVIRMLARISEAPVMSALEVCKMVQTSGRIALWTTKLTQPLQVFSGVCNLLLVHQSLFVASELQGRCRLKGARSSSPGYRSGRTVLQIADATCLSFSSQSGFYALQTVIQDHG